ncbi:MAG: hypothetical protein ACK4WM_03885 [Thermoflexales bacterium]
MERRSTLLLTGLAATLAAVCLCGAGVIGSTVWLAVRLHRAAQGSAGVASVNPLPTPTQIDLAPAYPLTLPDQPAESSAGDVVAHLANHIAPKRDLREIAVRFGFATPAEAEPSCLSWSPPLEVGTRRTFTLTNQDDNTLFQAEAELRYVNPHTYMWVQTAPQRVRLDQQRLVEAAEHFANHIYPKLRAFFGSEETPGVDCDPRVHILHARGIGRTVGGYFSAPDALPRAVRSDSNEAQLFVIHAEPGYNGADPGSDTYLSTIAHELQHMISNHQVHASELWLEEGASQFAERLAGFANSIGTIYSFAEQPWTQLNYWLEADPGANSAQYGGAYLFWSYLHDRFGSDVLRALALHPERSVAGFMKVLARQGITNPDTGAPYTFPELFGEFVVANYQWRTPLKPADPRFHYTSAEVTNQPVIMRMFRRYHALQYPVQAQEGLRQFGTHYYELTGERPVTITFSGAARVALLPMREHDEPFWWSHRADDSNPRLTRRVDLTRVTRATLRYRAWYRLEKDYDYAYLSVSTDGGQTWALLEPPSCTHSNPQNANLGCGYTGSSGGAEPQWIEESVDLTPFAGRSIWLRFEVITDDGINREGFALDDVAIPEIGWRDDASTPADWLAEGWVRVRNTLPQHWLVQAILTNADGSYARQIMNLHGSVGQLRIDLGGAVQKAVLAISPITLVTTEPAGYRLAIE